MRTRFLFSVIYIGAAALLAGVAYAQQTVFDFSGTIGTGGTSQQVIPYNASRKYLLIENPTNATSEALFCNLGAAATMTQASITLALGGTYERSIPNFVPKDAVFCTAPTTGHTFTAKEG